jgi:hypothetical protein
MGDARPPMDVHVRAFSVAITVTPPLEDTVDTYGIWLSPLVEEDPIGTELARREPRRVMAITIEDLETIPRGTEIVAPEMENDEEITWLVDGTELKRADEIRVILVRKLEP